MRVRKSARGQLLGKPLTSAAPTICANLLAVLAHDPCNMAGRSHSAYQVGTALGKIRTWRFEDGTAIFANSGLASICSAFLGRKGYVDNGISCDYCLRKQLPPRAGRWPELAGRERKLRKRYIVVDLYVIVNVHLVRDDGTVKLPVAVIDVKLAI